MTALFRNHCRQTYLSVADSVKRKYSLIQFLVPEQHLPLLSRYTPEKLNDQSQRFISSLNSTLYREEISEVRMWVHSTYSIQTLKNSVP